MQAAAADPLRSPIQGEQGSAARSSMWPVLVLGILTAIIAWVWYRGEEKQTESPVQTPEEAKQTVTAETAQESGESALRPKESALSAADPERCEATSGEQEVPCPEVYQPRCEQQPKSEVQELSDVEHPKSGSEGPSNAAATTTTVPPKVQEGAGVTGQLSLVPELQGPIQKQENHVKKGLHSNIKEHLQKEEEVQAPTQEHLPDLQKEEEAQAHTQENLPDLQKEEAQAYTQENLPDLQKEEAQAYTQENLPDLQKEEAQAYTQENLPDLQKEEAQAYTQEHLPDLQKEEEVQACRQENLPDLQREEEAQAYRQENLPDLQREEEAQAYRQEHLPDLQKEEEVQAYRQEHLPDLQRKEAQAYTQENLPDTSEKEDEEANLVEHLTRVPGIQDSLEDVVHANGEEPYKEYLDKNDDLPNHEGDVHFSNNPEVRELLSNGDEVYPPLKAEEYPQDLDRPLVQTNEEGGGPTLMSGEPEAQKLLVDSCHASKSKQENGQGEECVHSVTADGVYANGGVQGAEHAAGFQQDNLFKENAVNVLEAKKTLTHDLEMIHTSRDDGYTIVADPFMTQESVEKCDIKRMCSSTEKASIAVEDNDVCAGISNESPQEGLLHFQKLEAAPETSSVDVFNFMSKQEKNLSGLGSTDTDEKTTFGGSSEANTHEIENQKARKVATIQPLPPQNVDFAFRVHYITHSDSQIIAVIGDHEKLGKWEAYVPLTSANGGFWTHSITLPADTTLAWKFVMVENGKIKRWEECNNRFLKTAHEDIEAHLYWGCP